MTSFYLLDHEQPVTQQWGYPRRGASLSGTCIVHTAECAMDFDGADSSAENCAAFINNRSDYGSYHTLVDSDSIIEMAPYEYETWQDSETNPWAVGISAAVQADAWHLIPSDRRDRIYRNMAATAADFVDYMKTKGITVPLRRITGAEARARVPGFCAHGDSGIDRHDPGAGFDWALFFKYTAQALAGTIASQSTTTAPAEKDTDDMPTYKRVPAITRKAGATKLGAGRTWYLKDKAGKANLNLSPAAGMYDVDLFLSGTGLTAGEAITVQFVIVTVAGKRSGYFSQDIPGTKTGAFRGHARFSMPVPKGAFLEVAVTSSATGPDLTTYGADIKLWQ